MAREPRMTVAECDSFHPCTVPSQLAFINGLFFWSLEGAQQGTQQGRCLGVASALSQPHQSRCDFTLTSMSHLAADVAALCCWGENRKHTRARGRPKAFRSLIV